MTDVAILDVLGSDKCEMIFSDTPDEELPHPFSFKKIRDRMMEITMPIR